MSWHLTEKWLLLLRMFLLGLFCFILARPVWENEDAPMRHWILIEPQLSDTPEIKKLRDTTSAVIKYLRPGFPEEIPTASRSFSYWSLAEQAAIHHVDSMTIIASPEMRYYKGKRPALSIPVSWITLPAINDQQKSVLLKSYTGASGKVYDFFSISDPNIFQVRREPAENGALSPDTLKVHIAGDPANPETVTLFEIAFTTLAEYLDVPVIVQKTDRVDQINQEDWLVWLRPDPPLDQKNERLFYLVDERAGPAFIPSERNLVYMINGHITGARIVEEKVLSQLMRLLDPLDASAWEQTAQDFRVMAVHEAPGIAEKNVRGPEKRKNQAWLLWVLLAGGLVIERVWSTQKQ
jgi:hypothetical protein